nr:GntR family transcriptional regulator [Paracoccus sp. S-4012]
MSEQAYDRIRRDIILGEWRPGEKLLLEAVSDRYEIGMVPVREALNRLSAEGLVLRERNRGFSVSALSMDDLEELVSTRIQLETLALRTSIERGDEAWEELLVLSYHRLSRTNRMLPHEAGRERVSDEWEPRHRAFHLALLNACGSRWLLGFCETMMDHAVRYRNVSMNAHASQLRREGANGEHEAILQAALERDAGRACALLAEHYSATLDGVRDVVGTTRDPAWSHAPESAARDSGRIAPTRR